LTRRLIMDLIRIIITNLSIARFQMMRIKTKRCYVSKQP
jgi:hypothetical protein